MVDDLEEQKFDDFKKMVESSFPTSTLDIIADKYDEIVPKSVQLLANLDPTGIASTINQCLVENKARSEQENILYAIYCCWKSISEYEDRFRSLENEYLGQQGPELMNLYFENCKNTYNRKKINFFRNVWVNGMTKDDRDLDEKAYVFDLVASLTLDQIIVLRHIYKNTTNETDTLNLAYIAKELKINEARAQHLCTNLQSRGLLQIRYQTGGGWGVECL
jgi:vesicle coat complex subunit